jgi:hypothetical protein
MPSFHPLRESTLRAFFCDEISTSQLAAEVAGCVEQIDSIRQNVHIRRNLAAEFPLTRECLLKLCGAALEGELPPAALSTIAFTLVATDRFLWDADEDDVLAAVIYDWAGPPRIFYELTPENLQRCRRWLLNEERYPNPPKPNPKAEGRGQLIFERHTVFDG